MTCRTCAITHTQEWVCQVAMDIQLPFIIIAAMGIPVNILVAAIICGAGVEVVHAHGHGGDDGDDGYDHGHSHGGDG